MMPTADEVAVAIVTACRETGDDPIAICGGEMMLRGRHYALHALVRVYPDAHVLKLVRVIGISGDAMEFWRNSKRVAGKTGTKKPARWWSQPALNRVIEAVFVEAGLKSLAEAPAVQIPVKPKVDAGVTRIARAVAKIESRPSVPARPEPKIAFQATKPKPGGISSGKRSLYEMLGDAVRNTAKLPKGD